MERFEPYLESVLEQAPRLLGQLDRKPLSFTYGCFDSQYWQYAVSDFPCSRHQEAVLTLALLYKTRHKSNPYFRNPRIIEWINASLRFWAKMQSRDGSMSEWYPGEHSFGATAFGAYAISETLLLLKEEIENADAIKSRLCRTAEWLAGNSEMRAQNQECGAALALYNIYLLTGDSAHKRRAEDKATRIMSLQRPEGWFEEYGGPDIGYLSLALFYLAELYKKSGLKGLRKTIESSVYFISWFMHPDLTSGGVYGSRNTEYLFPYCFEMLGKGIAAMVAQHARKSIAINACVSPHSFDDRYLSYVSYIYIKSFLESRKLKSVPGPRYKKDFIKNFSDAGLLVFSGKGRYMVCNYKKGGAFFAFADGNSLQDSGIDADAGRRLTSGIIGDFSSSFDGKKLSVSGALSEVRNRTMNTKRSMLLRAFQYSLGRSSRMSLFAKKVLRDKMITDVYGSGLTFRREIELGKRIKVTDELPGRGIRSAFVGSKSSYIYVPSSRYFQRNEISAWAGNRRLAKQPDGSFRLARILG